MRQFQPWGQERPSEILRIVMRCDIVGGGLEGCAGSGRGWRPRLVRQECPVPFWVGTWCQKAQSGWAAHQNSVPWLKKPTFVPPEFEEPRVIDLWDLAKSANFTGEELDSLRVSWLLQCLSLSVDLMLAGSPVVPSPFRARCTAGPSLVQRGTRGWDCLAWTVQVRFLAPPGHLHSDWLEKGAQQLSQSEALASCVGPAHKGW